MEELVLTLDLNWLAVALAAVAYIAIGAVWYSPPIAGRRWAALAGRPISAGPVPIAVSVAGAIVAAVAMALVIRQVALPSSPIEGLVVGALAWVGFVATTGLVETMFGGRSLALWAIGAVYQLAGFLAMGAILGWLL